MDLHLFSVFSLLLGSVMFILCKDELVPKCIQQHKNTDQNVATCSSPMEGENMRPKVFYPDLELDPFLVAT